MLILKIESTSYIHKPNFNTLNGIFPVVLIFVLMSFGDGDNFHYIKWFYFANRGGVIDETLPQEPIYQILSYIFNGNYFLFRVFVWGSALIIYSLNSRRLGIPPRVSLICLYCLFLFIFSYGRATLGFCCYFYGFSFLIKPFDKKIVSYFLGCLYMLLSIVFHNSTIVLIILTIPVILFPKLKVNKFTVYKIILYVLCIIISISFTILAIEEFVESADIPLLSERVKKYTNMEENSKGIYVFLIEFMLSIIMIIGMYISIKSLYKKKINIYHVDKLFIMSLTIFVIGITLSFMGPGYAVFSYRIKYMDIIPISLLVAYCANHGILSYNKLLKLEYLGASLIIFRLLFYYYLTTKGLGIDTSSQL